MALCGLLTYLDLLRMRYAHNIRRAVKSIVVRMGDMMDDDDDWTYL